MNFSIALILSPLKNRDPVTYVTGNKKFLVNVEGMDRSTFKKKDKLNQFSQVLLLLFRILSRYYLSIIPPSFYITTDILRSLFISISKQKKIRIFDYDFMIVMDNQRYLESNISCVALKSISLFLNIDAYHFWIERNRLIFFIIIFSDFTSSAYRRRFN